MRFTTRQFAQFRSEAVLSGGRGWGRKLNVEDRWLGRSRTGRGSVEAPRQSIRDRSQCLGPSWVMWLGN